MRAYALVLALLVAPFVCGQGGTANVRAVRVDGIIGSDQVINTFLYGADAPTVHTFCVAGTGTWSVQIQYQDAPGAPWINFSDTSSLVTNTTATAVSPCTSLGIPNAAGVGVALGYRQFIRFQVVGLATVSYRGLRDAYVGAGGGISGGIPSTSNLIKGDGMGGASDSGIVPTAVAVNPTVTAGTGGVTANLIASKDTSVPTKYVLPGAGGCGGGIALTTAAANATFTLQTLPGVINMIADNAVTAGHLLTGGSTTPGRAADTGQTGRGSISSATCILGVAQSSGSAGATISVLYDGIGNYGTLNTVDATAMSAGNFCAATGTGAAYVCTPGTATLTLQAGNIYYVSFPVISSTTAPQINVSGTGNKTITAADGTTFITTTAITTNGVCRLYFDGSTFRASGPCIGDPTAIPYRCGAAPPTPATAGDIVTYCDSADGHSKRIDSAGTVFDFQSAGGLTTSTTTQLIPFGMATAQNTAMPQNGAIYGVRVTVPYPMTIAQITINESRHSVHHGSWAVYSTARALLAAGTAGSSCGGCSLSFPVAYTFPAGGAYYLVFTTDSVDTLDVWTGAANCGNANAGGALGCFTTTTTATWSAGVVTWPGTIAAPAAATFAPMIVVGP